jgi:S-adenosylmethionine decarboxylase
LNNEELLREGLREAAQTAGATVLSVHSHKFTPVGVTAFALLAESHISIHTWPELGMLQWTLLPAANRCAQN